MTSDTESSDLFQYCNSVAVAISERYGSGSDVSKRMEEEQVVSLVWMTFGIIGNGGMRYLCEATINGDPSLAKTIRAYERIGAIDAARLVAEGVHRCRDLQSSGQTTGDDEDRLDRAFCEYSNEIVAKLAAFIREDTDLGS